MRLPVLRLAAVEIAFLLEMLEKLPLFLRFYPHLRRQIFEVGDQARHGRRVYEHSQPSYEQRGCPRPRMGSSERMHPVIPMWLPSRKFFLFSR